MLGRGVNFYASFKNKEPNKLSNDVSKQGKVSKIEILNPKDENAEDFGQYEFLYVSFESDQKLKIKATFGGAYHRALT